MMGGWIKLIEIRNEMGDFLRWFLLNELTKEIENFERIWT